MGSNRTERLLRPYPITREFLLRLPLLVPWGVVREVTGMSDAEVRDEVASGRLRTWRAANAKMRRYYRDDVLRIAGVLMDPAPARNPPQTAAIHPKPQCRVSTPGGPG